MPKKIKDESGTEIEVFDKSEVDALSAKAAEDKAKELEPEINPNWREARKKLSAYEQQLKEKDQQLEKAGVKGENTSVNAEEVHKIAEQKAEESYFRRYRDRLLETFGEKKETVGKYFEKLAQGEKLTTENIIEKLVAEAARAVGIQQTRNPDISARFGREGGAPRFQQENPDQGFGATEAGKATAAAMGLIIENPNKK